MKRYKLIHEYPGSPELNTEIIKSTIYGASSTKVVHTYMIKGDETFKLNNPKDYPEFWELVVEKDYEILSFSNDENLIWTKAIDGRFDAKWQMYRPTEEDSLKEPGITIHSIKRKSDGQIFTVGDDVLSKTCGVPNKILSIELINNKIRLYPRNSFYNLEDISKVKQKLFTTEDGVDIFEGDRFYRVTKDLEFWDISGEVNKQYGYKHLSEIGIKHFSAKEKAEEYILMNKPCLSLNDIFKDVEKMRKGLKTFENSELAKRFKKLVQQKIK